MQQLQKDRIDAVKAQVYWPVPPEIFDETERRIHEEIAILKAHGKNPGIVTCIVADRILQDEGGLNEKGIYTRINEKCVS